MAGQFLNQFKSALKLETKVLRDAGDLMSRYSDALGKQGCSLQYWISADRQAGVLDIEAP